MLISFHRFAPASLVVLLEFQFCPFEYVIRTQLIPTSRMDMTSMYFMVGKVGTLVLFSNCREMRMWVVKMLVCLWSIHIASHPLSKWEKINGFNFLKKHLFSGRKLMDSFFFKHLFSSGYMLWSCSRSDTISHQSIQSLIHWPIYEWMQSFPVTGTCSVG